MFHDWKRLSARYLPALTLLSVLLFSNCSPQKRLAKTQEQRTNNTHEQFAADREITRDSIFFRELCEALREQLAIERTRNRTTVEDVETVTREYDTSRPADTLTGKPPLLREHRLYQADWLLRFYGFKADELLSVDRPNFNTMLDPKCDWALRHLDIYPVEINRASYDVLLRVPGIGTKSAFRIVKARRHGTLNFEHLKKMGVVLKRAKYFITCSGKMMYRIPIEEDFITRQLIGEDAKQNWAIDHPQTYRQLSLFDDFNFQSEVTIEDSSKTLFGQM